MAKKTPSLYRFKDVIQPTYGCCYIIKDIPKISGEAVYPFVRTKKNWNNECHSYPLPILQRASGGCEGSTVAIQGTPAVFRQSDLSYLFRKFRLAVRSTRLVLVAQRQSSFSIQAQWLGQGTQSATSYLISTEETQLAPDKKSSNPSEALVCEDVSRLAGWSTESLQKEFQSSPDRVALLIAPNQVSVSPPRALGVEELPRMPAKGMLFPGWGPQLPPDFNFMHRLWLVS